MDRQQHSNGHFDAIIVAIGTCGEPQMPNILNREKFQGEMFHTSQLRETQATGKSIIVVGGYEDRGAGIAEALEFAAATNASKTCILVSVSLLSLIVSNHTPALANVLNISAIKD